MTVTAPQRPKTAVYADSIEALHEEALIKEARERTRRRHQKYAAAAAIAAAAVGVGAAFATRAAGGHAHPTGASARPIAPASSATRSTIVFARWRGTPDGKVTATLYPIRAGGTGLHRLLSGSQARVAGSWPALSPDGREVAFQAGDPDLAHHAIDLVKLDGSGLHEIVSNGEHPSWSPDGTHLVYAVFTGNSRGTYVVRADGTARRRLTRAALLPAWSPDGTKLAYGCPAYPPYHTCVMNADGTGQHRIAAPGNLVTPAWSPDGTKIAFLGGFPHVRVFVVRADGTNLRRLAPPVSYKSQDCGPAWSPDGKRIAFNPAGPPLDGGPPIDGGTGRIYLMNADGRHVVHVRGTSNACGITWRRTPTNS